MQMPTYRARCNRLAVLTKICYAGYGTLYQFMHVDLPVSFTAYMPVVACNATGFAQHSIFSNQYKSLEERLMSKNMKVKLGLE